MSFDSVSNTSILKRSPSTLSSIGTEMGHLKNHSIQFAPSSIARDILNKNEKPPQRKVLATGFEAAPQQGISLDNKALAEKFWAGENNTINLSLEKTKQLTKKFFNKNTGLTDHQKAQFMMHLLKTDANIKNNNFSQPNSFLNIAQRHLISQALEHIKNSDVLVNDKINFMKDLETLSNNNLNNRWVGSSNDTNIHLDIKKEIATLNRSIQSNEKVINVFNEINKYKKIVDDPKEINNPKKLSKKRKDLATGFKAAPQQGISVDNKALAEKFWAGENNTTNLSLEKTKQLTKKLFNKNTGLTDHQKAQFMMHLLKTDANIKNNNFSQPNSFLNIAQRHLISQALEHIKNSDIFVKDKIKFMKELKKLSTNNLNSRWVSSPDNERIHLEIKKEIATLNQSIQSNENVIGIFNEINKYKRIADDPKEINNPKKLSKEDFDQSKKVESNGNKSDAANDRMQAAEQYELAANLVDEKKTEEKIAQDTTAVVASDDYFDASTDVATIDYDVPSPDNQKLTQRILPSAMHSSAMEDFSDWATDHSAEIDLKGLNNADSALLNTHHENKDFDGAIADEGVSSARLTKSSTSNTVSSPSMLSSIEGIPSEEALAIEADEMAKIEQKMAAALNSNNPLNELKTLLAELPTNEKLTPQLKARYRVEINKQLEKFPCKENAEALASAGIKGETGKTLATYAANSALIAGAIMEMVGFIMAIIKIAGSHQNSEVEETDESESIKEIAEQKEQIANNNAAIEHAENQLPPELQDLTPELLTEQIEEYKEQISTQEEEMGKKGYLGKSLEDIRQEVTERKTLESMRAGNQGYEVLESGDRGDARPDNVALREGKVAGDAAFAEAQQMQQKHQADQATFDALETISKAQEDNQTREKLVEALQKEHALITTTPITEKQSYSDAFISLMSLGGVLMAGSLAVKGGWSRQGSTAVVHALQRKKTNTPVEAPSA